MKNELIITDKVDTENLDYVIKSAESFFRTKVDFPDDIKIVEIPNDEGTIQYDIEYHGIELGSYGIRHCQFLNWIYGTGCAEPRLSKVMTYL